jgi:hypothetical protein
MKTRTILENNIGVLDPVGTENRSPTKEIAQAAPQASAVVRPALESLGRQSVAEEELAVPAAVPAFVAPAPRRVQFNLFGRVDVAGILTEVSEKQRILAETVPSVATDPDRQAVLAAAPDPDLQPVPAGNPDPDVPTTKPGAEATPQAVAGTKRETPLEWVTKAATSEPETWIPGGSRGYRGYWSQPYREHGSPRQAVYVRGRQDSYKLNGFVNHRYLEPQDEYRLSATPALEFHNRVFHEVESGLLNVAELERERIHSVNSFLSWRIIRGAAHNKEKKAQYAEEDRQEEARKVEEGRLAEEDLKKKAERKARKELQAKEQADKEKKWLRLKEEEQDKELQSQQAAKAEVANAALRKKETEQRMLHRRDVEHLDLVELGSTDEDVLEVPRYTVPVPGMLQAGQAALSRTVGKTGTKTPGVTGTPTLPKKVVKAQAKAGAQSGAIPKVPKPAGTPPKPKRTPKEPPITLDRDQLNEVIRAYTEQTQSILVATRMGIPLPPAAPSIATLIRTTAAAPTETTPVMPAAIPPVSVVVPMQQVPTPNQFAPGRMPRPTPQHPAPGRGYATPPQVAPRSQPFVPPVRPARRYSDGVYMPPAPTPVVLFGRGPPSTLPPRNYNHLPGSTPTYGPDFVLYPLGVQPAGSLPNPSYRRNGTLVSRIQCGDFSLVPNARYWGKDPRIGVYFVLAKGGPGGCYIPRYNGPWCCWCDLYFVRTYAYNNTGLCERCALNRGEL